MYKSRGTTDSSSWTFRLEPAVSAARWQDLVVDTGEEGSTTQPSGTMIEVWSNTIFGGVSPCFVSPKLATAPKAARLTKTATVRPSDRHTATTLTTWRAQASVLTGPLAVSPRHGYLCHERPPERHDIDQYDAFGACPDQKSANRHRSHPHCLLSSRTPLDETAHHPRYQADIHTDSSERRHPALSSGTTKVARRGPEPRNISILRPSSL